MNNYRLLCLALVLSANTTVQAAQSKYPELSPYSAVRWIEDQPEVLVDQRWFRMLKLNDLPVDDIISFSKQRYADRWQKRFVEDLVRVLSEMGHPPGDTVDLVVRDLDDYTVTTLKGVTLTKAKRTAAWVYRNGRKKQITPQARTLSRAHARADIDQLRTLLDDNYAYATLRGYDYHTNLDTLSQGLTAEVNPRKFALALRKIVARFGDGHSRVRGWRRMVPSGYAPFKLCSLSGRVVALNADGGKLFYDGHPFVQSIDDVPIEQWVAAAAVLVADGSPQFVRRGALEVAGCVQFVRGEFDRAPSATFDVRLQSAGGVSRVQTVQVVSTPPPAAGLVDFSHRRIASSVGYMRMPSMRRHHIRPEQIVAAMNSLRDTSGLIIDVRGNVGGNREALRTLFPYFMRATDKPHVANVARYRLTAQDGPGKPQGYLADRALYSLSTTRWPDSGRAALVDFADTFKPAWQVPERGFSDWHYMLLSPSTDESVYHYDERVVLLMDGDCFSATDIFLGAFKGWRNVTLMGTPSGGGSGRARGHQLRYSKIEIRLSTMASYQPNGLLYDGNGIQPDRVIEPTLSDFLGQTDRVLDAAIALLIQPQPPRP